MEPISICTRADFNRVKSALPAADNASCGSPPHKKIAQRDAFRLICAGCILIMQNASGKVGQKNEKMALTWLNCNLKRVRIS